MSADAIQAIQSSLIERAARVAQVASIHANDVDRLARFPAEAISAMREERLLGVQISAEFGGEGTSIALLGEICSILGQKCAATAMVFAMHQIKVSSLVAHGSGSIWHEDFMRKITRDQLLLASATTEAGIGGNLRNSICAIEVNGDLCSLEKDATVISYGENADAILITSRANAHAVASDQVMTVFERGQYELSKTHEWDTLGMRGTCSEGFLFKGEAPAHQIFSKPFAEIAAQSMLASSHLLWASVWFGIASDAVQKAQSFIRAAARKSQGAIPPGADRLADASVKLQTLKSTIRSGFETFENAKRDENTLLSMSFALAMNNVKITVSQGILDVINDAMMICGIAAYKNDTPFSLGRNLRDAHSAQLMISNDRILGNSATILLAQKLDTNLAG
jgi:acyl-CoA dehydrogenase